MKLQGPQRMDTLHGLNAKVVLTAKTVTDAAFLFMGGDESKFNIQ